MFEGSLTGEAPVYVEDEEGHAKEARREVLMRVFGEDSESGVHA